MICHDFEVNWMNRSSLVSTLQSWSYKESNNDDSSKHYESQLNDILCITRALATLEVTNLWKSQLTVPAHNSFVANSANSIGFCLISCKAWGRSWASYKVWACITASPIPTQWSDHITSIAFSIRITTLACCWMCWWIVEVSIWQANYTFTIGCIFFTW